MAMNGAEFFTTALAAAVGFLPARLLSGWIDSKVNFGSYHEQGRNSELNDVLALIGITRDLGVKYWLRDYDPTLDPEEGAYISAYVAQAGMMIDHLLYANSGLKVGPFAALDRFDEALTGGYAGVKKRKRELSRVIQITISGTEISQALKASRRRLRPKWFEGV